MYKTVSFMIMDAGQIRIFQFTPSLSLGPGKGCGKHFKGKESMSAPSYIEAYKKDFHLNRLLKPMDFNWGRVPVICSNLGHTQKTNRYKALFVELLAQLKSAPNLKYLLVLLICLTPIFMSVQWGRVNNFWQLWSHCLCMVPLMQFYKSLVKDIVDSQKIGDNSECVFVQR